MGPVLCASKHTCTVSHEKGSHWIKVSHPFNRPPWNDLLSDSMPTPSVGQDQNIACIINNNSPHLSMKYDPSHGLST